MNDQTELEVLISDPARRRCWLLGKALEGWPLDRAIDLARTADAFITGGGAELPIGDAARQPTSPAAVVAALDDRPLDATADIPPNPKQPPISRPARVMLSADRREHLLDRLAAGASNAEIAARLGLASKQVQGIRMGSAREIAKRRESLNGSNQPALEPRPLPASKDEVVRYLRQQDDVVVPQGDGEFLVNARFRLSLAELISRANRMRARQGKPNFEFANGHQAQVATMTNGNGLHRRTLELNLDQGARMQSEQSDHP